MPSTYTHTLPILISILGDESEFLAEVTYTYSPGYPGRGPSLSSPGEPPEGPEIEVLSARLQVSEWKDGLNRKVWLSAPAWLVGAIADSEGAFSALDEAARDYLAEGPDGQFGVGA
jgi:hypothetical protein